MKTRLLLISVIVLFCTAFNNAVGRPCPDKQTLSEIISEHISDQEIDSPDQKLLVPRQTNFASQPQTRTISKRQSNQRNSSRYSLYISGRPVDLSFIRTYQLLVSLFPTGLNDSYRFFISLCKLII